MERGGVRGVGGQSPRPPQGGGPSPAQVTAVTRPQVGGPLGGPAAPWARGGAGGHKDRARDSRRE